MTHPHRPAHHGRGRRIVWITLGLIVLALLISINFLREVARSRQIDREIASLRDEAERLRAKNFQIRTLSLASQKDEYFEREARLKLNLQKEGERVVVLHRPEDKPKDGLPAEASGEGWSNPKRWFTYFADRKSYDRHAAELHAQ